VTLTQTTAAVLVRLRRAQTSRRTRALLHAAFAAVVAAVSTLTIRHFVESGWPLGDADALAVGIAGGLFLVAYGFKAVGWRAVFAAGERPGSHALAAAAGAACVTGVALPGRFDDVVRVAVARRFGCMRAGLGTLVLSIVVVGFIDSAALAPLASIAAGLAETPPGVRAGLALVAAAGVGAAVIVVALPRLTISRRLRQFRLVRWLAANAACTRDASKAWLLISTSWSLRALAVYVLLGALGVSGSFAIALLFLCATAASAALPVAPAGAATQAGAGAAVLALSGIETSEAIAFAIAAQALLVVAGAAVVVAAGAWEAGKRLGVASLAG